MANAIKQISIQRGYDVTEYTLNCFGGAGGQHACLVADALGMTRVFVHPFAGVLSAYGMGLADLRVMRERAVEATFTDESGRRTRRGRLGRDGGRGPSTRSCARARSPSRDRGATQQVHLRYEGTDSPLMVDFADRATMVAAFEAAHHQQYGFIAPEKGHIIEAVDGRDGRRCGRSHRPGDRSR